MSRYQARARKTKAVRFDAGPTPARLPTLGETGEGPRVTERRQPCRGRTTARRPSAASAPRTLLQLIQEMNIAQGRAPARRADLRIDTGPGGRIVLLNKHDGVTRRLVPQAASGG